MRRVVSAAFLLALPLVAQPAPPVSSANMVGASFGGWYCSLGSQHIGAWAEASELGCASGVQSGIFPGSMGPVISAMWPHGCVNPINLGGTVWAAAREVDTTAPATFVPIGGSQTWFLLSPFPPPPTTYTWITWPGSPPDPFQSTVYNPATLVVVPPSFEVYRNAPSPYFGACSVLVPAGGYMERWLGLQIPDTVSANGLLISLQSMRLDLATGLLHFSEMHAFDVRAF